MTAQPDHAIGAIGKPHEARLFVLAIRFADWADREVDEPTIARICTRFRVSRATAYRWRTAYRTARTEAAA